MGYGVWVGGVNFRERPLVRVRDGGEYAGLGRDMCLDVGNSHALLGVSRIPRVLFLDPSPPHITHTPTDRHAPRCCYLKVYLMD